jgi:hypothetical protein
LQEDVLLESTLKVVTDQGLRDLSAMQVDDFEELVTMDALCEEFEALEAFRLLVEVLIAPSLAEEVGQTRVVLELLAELAEAIWAEEVPRYVQNLESAVSL